MYFIVTTTIPCNCHHPDRVLPSTPPLPPSSLSMLLPLPSKLLVFSYFQSSYYPFQPAVLIFYFTYHYFPPNYYHFNPITLTVNIFPSITISCISISNRVIPISNVKRRLLSCCPHYAPMPLSISVFPFARYVTDISIQHLFLIQLQPLISQFHHFNRIATFSDQPAHIPNRNNTISN